MTRTLTRATRLGILVLGALVSLVLGARESRAQESPSGQGVETFDTKAEGTHMALETVVGTFSGPGRSLRIMQRLGADFGEYALRLGAPRDGQKMPTIQVRLDLPQAASAGTVLSMDAQRAARRKRFQLEAEFRGGAMEGSRRNLTPDLVLDEFRRIDLVLPEGTTSVVLHLTAPPTIGVDLDNVEIRAPKRMTVSGVTSRYFTSPAGIGRGGPAAPSRLAELCVETDGVLEPRTLDSVRVKASAEGVRLLALRLMDEDGERIAEAKGPFESAWVDLAPGVRLRHGANTFGLVAELEPLRPPAGFVAPVDGSGTDRFALAGAPFAVSFEVAVSAWPSVAVESSGTPPRSADVLALHDQDVLGTALLAARGGLKQATRLVAAVTRQTKGGARIQFYGSASSGRLEPGASLGLDLDGEWSAYAPTLIEERPSGTIHAFFMVQDSSGHRIWRTRSSDRGVTWASAEWLEWTVPAGVAPPASGSPRLLGGRGVPSAMGPWSLLVEVPGEEGHRLLVSKDSGKSFTLSASTGVPGKGGALVELGPGALLVDTFLPGTGRRYLVATSDFGETWTDALAKRRPLLGCAGEGAAIIHVGHDITGGADWRLLFANVVKGPTGPDGLTVRGSNDNGDNWFDRVALLLDERDGADLPALAVLDKDTAAVLYRSGQGELCVQYVEFPAILEKIRTFRDVFGAGSGLKR